eukprot:GHVQ01025678.1.p1 GENE.GHVQ01025678.1~~GHVQ01025678.1.p1  ORF type:complete len:342 (+),score=62.36 GHVQ01025678.1:83-1108(+)
MTMTVNRGPWRSRGLLGICYLSSDDLLKAGVLLLLVGQFYCCTCHVQAIDMASPQDVESYFPSLARKWFDSLLDADIQSHYLQWNRWSSLFLFKICLLKYEELKKFQAIRALTKSEAVAEKAMNYDDVVDFLEEWLHDDEESKKNIELYWELVNTEPLPSVVLGYLFAGIPNEEKHDFVTSLTISDCCKFDRHIFLSQQKMKLYYVHTQYQFAVNHHWAYPGKAKMYVTDKTTECVDIEESEVKDNKEGIWIQTIHSTVDDDTDNDNTSTVADIMTNPASNLPEEVERLKQTQIRYLTEAWIAELLDNVRYLVIQRGHDDVVVDSTGLIAVVKSIIDKFKD